MRTEALPSLIFSACPVYCLHAGAVQASHFYLLHVSIHSLTSPTSLFIIHGLPANSYNRWTVSVPHSMFKCHPQQRSHTASGFPSSLSYFLFLCLGLTHITYRDMKTAIALASVATAYFFIVSQYRYLYLYSTGFQMYHIVVWSLNLCVFYIETQQNKESASPDGQ